MIDQHGAAIAHDFQAIYGVSLVDVVADLCSGSPRYSPWWWLGLIEGLPDTSATAASVRGGSEYRGWGLDRYILTALVDAIQINTVATARVAGAKGVKDPEPWPRPGEESKKKRGRHGLMGVRGLMGKRPKKPPAVEGATRREG